jgi:hypothetical protein
MIAAFSAFNFDLSLIRSGKTTTKEEPMRVKTFMPLLAFCFFAGAVCVAQDALMGTWKLNEAKSKVDPRMGKNETVIYAKEGENIKITVDGVEPDGKPRHTEWVGKFDGNEYPVTGDLTTDSRSYKVMNDHMLTMINKKGAKETSRGTIEVAPDGKTRTVHLTATDAKGDKVELTAVYEKQ